MILLNPKKGKSFLFILFYCVSLGNFCIAQTANKGYQMPPAQIAKIVEETVNQRVIFSDEAKYLAILQAPTYIDLEELAQPQAKLAGLRINLNTKQNSRNAFYNSIKIKNIRNDEEFSLAGLPANFKLSNFSFSPNEEMVAFTLLLGNELQLWIGDLNKKTTARLSDAILNDTYGTVYQWSPNSKTVLAKCVANLPAPVAKKESFSPNIQETNGQAAINRTYQDLLKNPNDEEALDRHLTAQIKMVYLDGQAINYSRPEIYQNFDFSPDGDLVMLWIVHKPYSYVVPINYFPCKVEVRDRYGKEIKVLADMPLADNLPQGFDAVITGPRAFEWRADKPKTAFWVEAQDKGDPYQTTSIRDNLYTLDFTEGSPLQKKLGVCYLRYTKIDWGTDQIAMVTERWWNTRGERRVFIKPDNSSYRVNLWDRYYEDAYNDPGEFVKVKNQYGRDVLLLDKVAKGLSDVNNMNIFSISEGASPAGNRPFLLKFNVKTKLTDTIFRSKAPFYEKPVFFDNKQDLIISRETVAQPANYFYLDYYKNKVKQLTFFENPYPELAGVIKKQLSYKRADGLNLTANLYLPQNYNTNTGKLPVLMWAYPKEFKTLSAAGQVKSSPYQFTKISWGSPIYWVTRGYAVMDNVDMPIVGESNDKPNDTFISQLTENALAAVNKVVNMGIGDKDRIAIGGHSYGAFMTANLLAHTTLFKAGIARSGAYNRTLTPFGFQAEERTYWQAPELYFKMSPFSYANQIKAPLLLIHGENDDNSGTFPIQSERLYSAIKGFGGTARLVYLPFEAHSYKAKESVLHMLYEMDAWLEKYVKNK
jgi:dipeptidyl aminopeptidase/acylaminoacyl peptidase